MTFIDPQFSRHWRSYIVQGLLAGVVILITFNLPSIKGDIVLVGSLGSTAFLVFSLPSRITASLKNCVIGHGWGLFAGSISFQAQPLFPLDATVSYAVAVTLAFYLMVITNTDHAPAAGTALAVAMNGITWHAALWVLGVAALIAAAKIPLKGRIRDLRD